MNIEPWLDICGQGGYLLGNDSEVVAGPSSLQSRIRLYLSLL